jgi:hypothetical protein
MYLYVFMSIFIDDICVFFVYEYRNRFVQCMHVFTDVYIHQSKHTLVYTYT